jgi:hypothetical protein
MLTTGICIGMLHNKLARRRRTSGERVIPTVEEEEEMNVDLDHSDSSQSTDPDQLHESVV